MIYIYQLLDFFTFKRNEQIPFLILLYLYIWVISAYFINEFNTQLYRDYAFVSVAIFWSIVISFILTIIYDWNERRNERHNHNSYVLFMSLLGIFIPLIWAINERSFMIYADKMVNEPYLVHYEHRISPDKYHKHYSDEFYLVLDPSYRFDQSDIQIQSELSASTYLTDNCEKAFETNQYQCKVPEEPWVSGKFEKQEYDGNGHVVLLSGYKTDSRILIQNAKWVYESGITDIDTN